MDPRVGQQIGGYRIEEPIGRGGMGVVYRAEQLALGRVVALKLIAPELAEDDEFRERFQRESRLAASIDHPNVIPVHEAGEADGVLFIVMRYVDGTDLRALIRRDGGLAPPRATQLLGQIAAALDAAHARGLVHRDVKPANVLIAEGDHAYLTDFGLTKRVGSAGLTATGRWVGTLDYVAPEQIEGRSVDARADVYALGCVLVEALSGSVPFPHDSDVAKMYAHVNEPPPVPTSRDPGLPPELDEVVARALAKNPDARYPSAGDLGRAATAAVQGEVATTPERSVAAGAAAPDADATRPLDAMPPPPPTYAAPTPATARLPESIPPAPRPAPPPPGAPPPAPPRRRGPGLAIAAVLAALLGVGAAAVFATGVLEDDTKTVTEENGTGTGPDGTGTNEDGRTRRTRYQTYDGAAYTAEVPRGWRRVKDDELVTSYHETRYEDPGGDGYLLIDRTPGETTDPEEKYQQVEADVSRGATYRRISAQRVTLRGRPGFEWVYQNADGRFVDYFFSAGGDGFAVFGAGADFETVLEVTRHAAETLRTR